MQALIVIISGDLGGWREQGEYSRVQSDVQCSDVQTLKKLW